MEEYPLTAHIFASPSKFYLIIKLAVLANSVS